MNILAHSYLSGNSDELKIGNFIGDYVKGQNYQHYPVEIQKGIILHRNIDFYTDHHDIVNQSKTYLYPVFHKYSGIIVDIFYDHFLARNWHAFSQTPLEIYIQSLYKLILSHYDILPERLQKFIHRFVQNDWLSYYSTIDGIDHVLRRLSERTSLPKSAYKARGFLIKYYDQFKEEFTIYFPQLMVYVRDHFFVDLSLPKNITLSDIEPED